MCEWATGTDRLWFGYILWGPVFCSVAVIQPFCKHESTQREIPSKPLSAPPHTHTHDFSYYLPIIDSYIRYNMKEAYMLYTCYSKQPWPQRWKWDIKIVCVNDEFWGICLKIFNMKQSEEGNHTILWDAPKQQQKKGPVTSDLLILFGM